MEDKFIELVKNFGLEDSDLETIKTLEPGEDGKIDFSPFTTKVFNNHKESLKADTEYVSQFTKDYENKMIGLENQKKRAIRKEFGLVDIKEDDLKQIKFEDLLKKAKEVTSGTKDTDLQAERQRYLDEVDAREKEREEYEQRLQAAENGKAEFVKSFEINNKLQAAILTDGTVKPAALEVAMGAFKYFIDSKGWKVDQDTKGKLILIDTKSNTVAMKNNAPVKIDETIKEVFAVLAPNGNGRGDLNNFKKKPDGSPAISEKTQERLAMMGGGLG